MKRIESFHAYILSECALYLRYLSISNVSQTIQKQHQTFIDIPVPWKLLPLPENTAQSNHRLRRTSNLKHREWMGRCFRRDPDLSDSGNRTCDNATRALRLPFDSFAGSKWGALERVPTRNCPIQSGLTHFPLCLLNRIKCILYRFCTWLYNYCHVFAIFKIRENVIKVKSTLNSS